jgi:Fic family protein
MPSFLETEIIDFLKNSQGLSSGEIHARLASETSYATLKRVLQKLIGDNLIAATGRGKATKYQLSKAFGVIRPMDLQAYFEQEIDQRSIKSGFNFDLIHSTLGNISLFTYLEMSHLNGLQKKFENNIQNLSPAEFRNEMERLAIDLSWKSSQIEGNTYSLLETERLLKEKETASGKTKKEAAMLLNHKEAIDFMVENPSYLFPLTISGIEDIHRILVKELAVDKNLRRKRVGISGTNYRPPENEFQIREAMETMCALVNAKENIFEKSLLSLALISYIQPFMDGNKRTARIVSNAILMQHRFCPISYRTADSLEYKKAMLLFYEQNNLSAVKEMFMAQFEFAVKTYF